MTRVGDGDIAAVSAAQSARVAPARLKKRAEFLKTAKGRRQHQRCFVVQSRARDEDAAGAARFGFTVTKKVGNSVVRNRIRRRLREAVRLADPALPRPGHDYVVVARIEALSASFDELRGDLARALKKLHPSGPARRPPAADLKQEL